MAKLKDDPLSTYLIGEKVSKLDSRERFLGQVDELQCHIMLVRSLLDEDDELREVFLTIAKKLQVLMGEIAGGKGKITLEDIDYLIELKEKYEQNMGVVKEFVIPGQNRVSAEMHIARTITRRCELQYAVVYTEHMQNKVIFEFLNKMSLMLYWMSVTYDHKNIK